MYFRCVFTLLQWCVLVGLYWAEPMTFLSLHVTCSYIFHAYIPSFIFILILICLGAFLRISFSLSFFRLVALWHLNENPLRPRTLVVLGHLLPLTSLFLMYGSVMIKPIRNFSENFSRQGIHSKRQVILSDFADTNLPSVIHNRGWESLCDVPITCPLVLIQEFYSNMHRIDRSVPLFLTHVRGTPIPVTP